VTDPATRLLVDKIRVRPLEDADSLAHLTAMLHRAYKTHVDRGLRALSGFQPEEVTRKRIAHGECYVSTYLGKVVGTILFKDAAGTAGTPWFDGPGVASFSQLAVEPDLQGRGIGGVLIAKAEERARATGAAELALSTPQPATWLVEMYQRRGYRVVETHHWPETNYTSAIMSKAL
jgi:GNAT superfamily N-acetyltransferase